MALQRHLVIATSLVLLSGCTVGIRPAGSVPPPGHVAPPPPPPPPPPAQPRLLSQADAEHIALKLAADRGYQTPRFHQVKWKDEHMHWKIDLRGGVEGREAKLQMCVDARDGSVVGLKDKRHGKPDKDDKHEGKKHGKGHDKHDKDEKHDDKDDDDHHDHDDD